MPDINDLPSTNCKCVRCREVRVGRLDDLLSVRILQRQDAVTEVEPEVAEDLREHLGLQQQPQSPPSSPSATEPATMTDQDSAQPDLKMTGDAEKNRESRTGSDGKPDALPGTKSSPASSPGQDN